MFTRDYQNYETRQTQNVHFPMFIGEVDVFS